MQRMLQNLAVYKNNQNIETNIIRNRYITDGNIWTIDETVFNKNAKLF